MNQDIIDHPKHYTYAKVECWNWYECAMSDEEFRGAMKNNIWKYTFRAGHKDNEEAIKDLEKAKAYINRWIKFEQGERHTVETEEEWTSIEAKQSQPKPSGLRLYSRPNRRQRFSKFLQKLLHIGG
jgi:hypothetical protein